MSLTIDQRTAYAVLRPTGRLDAFGAKEFQRAMDEQLDQEAACLVIDLSAVDYLSSGALRVFLTLHRKSAERHGTVALCALHPYCRNVLEVAGCADVFPLFDSVEEAGAHCERVDGENISLRRWEELETLHLDCGTMRVLPGSDEEGAIEILGHIKDVLHAEITHAHLCSKRFSETEYSIGLGGLGDRVDDYFRIMGEMITIGGTMVWLPTDGHDTPDFLIPQKDTGGVMLRTAFNVSIAGEFNELMMFESSEEGGTTIDALYRALFGAAHERRPDFSGIIGLAIRAQMGAVFGSGVKKSPVRDFQPPDGEMIIAGDNMGEWFDCDTEPRHTDVTCLICGVGADLSSDLTAYDEHELNSVFYLHPANLGGKTELLHNHGVVFTELPLPERAVSIEQEINSVVSNGDFIDMRHLLDTSTIRRAFLGVSYVQALRRDPKGTRFVAEAGGGQ